MGSVHEGIRSALDELMDSKGGPLGPDPRPMVYPAADRVGEKVLYPSGATRDSEEGKLDYQGALSIEVLDSFVQYMDRHREMSPGSFRGMGNWKQGMPWARLMRSLTRHHFAVWRNDGQKLDDLHAVLFNTMALIYQQLTKED